MNERAIAAVKLLKSALSIEKSVKEAKEALQTIEALEGNMESRITTDFVIEMHNDLIATYGGASGLREPSLLSSACASAELVKQFADPSVYDLAAAYCYYLCMDHPFVDGNKRTACAVALVYLALNDIALIVEDCELVAVMVSVANKEMDKQQLAEWLESSTWSTRPMSSYELQSVYQEIKVYHSELFRELAKV